MNPRAFIGMLASTLYGIMIVASAFYFPHALPGVAVIGAMIVGAAWSLPGLVLKRNGAVREPGQAPQDAAFK